jgi:YVTN family beta-propeller protein
VRRLRVIVACLLLATAGGEIVAARLAATPVVESTVVGLGPGTTAVDERTGRVFVANTEDRTVSLLDSRTGRLVRTITVGFYPELVAVDASSGHAFIGTDEGQVNMLDGKTGSLLQSVRVGTEVADLAVDEQTGRVFGADPDDGTVSLLDASSGAVLASVAVSGDPQHVAVDAGTGRAFVASEDATGGYITVLDARSGAVVSAIRVGLAPRLSVQARVGRVLVYDRAGRISVLDARSGRLLRTTALGMDVYAGAVDERTGQVIMAAAPLGSAPSAVCRGAGRLVVLDARSAAVVKSVAVAARPCLVAVNPLTGHLLAVTPGAADSDGAVRGAGSLSVFDAFSLAPRGTFSVGLNPSGLALDARSGRAFVTNANVNPDGSATGATAPESGVVQVQRWLRQTLSWLPLPDPPPPTPILEGSVTVLDAAQL